MYAYQLLRSLSFRPITRKYRLVEALRRGRRKLRDISLTLSTDVPSRMPQPLQELMTDLVSSFVREIHCPYSSIILFTMYN